MDHHYETDESIAIKGELYNSLISVIKLSPSLDDMRVISGYIVSNLNEMCFCKTQIKVSLDTDMNDLDRKSVV